MIQKREFKLIDVMILGLFLVVGYFVAKKMFKKTSEIFVDLTPVRNYSQDITPPEYWEVEGISSGDVVYNVSGGRIGEVVEIIKTNWSLGKMKSTEMRLKLKATGFDSNWVVNSQPLRVGLKMTIVTNGYQYIGLIRNVYQKEEDRYRGYRQAKGIIKIMLRSYESWHAEALRNFVVKNSSGEMILKIKEIDIRPADVYVETRGNNKIRGGVETGDGIPIYKGKDPIKKDIILTVELPKLRCLDGVCYYNDYDSIGIGSEFWADNGETFFGYSSSVMEKKIEYVE